MELIAAQTLATELLTRHGLTAEGWTFAFDRAQRRLGACKYNRKQITISHYMTVAADRHTVHQTLLHEIAHALVGHAAAHGPVWKAKAASIGYTGGVTAANPYKAPARQTRRRPGVPSLVNVGTMLPRLQPGQTGILLTGAHAGKRATVRRVNSTRYTADVEGVGGMYIPFAMLRLDPTAAPVEKPSIPMTQILHAGQKGRIVNGRFAGRTVTIEKVNRSRYDAEIEGAGPGWKIPFEMVTAG